MAATAVRTKGTIGSAKGKRIAAAAAVRTAVQIISAAAGAVAGTLVLANRAFRQSARRDVVEMFARSEAEVPGMVTEADLQGLPEPVQRWLRYAGVVGKERISEVRLKQRGQFKLGAGMPWSPMTAEQYYTVNPPAFVWHATMKLTPFFWIKGEDRYADGKGRMLVRLLGLIPLVDARGPELDQGTLLRYLSEMPWFPSAALAGYIKWEPVDDNSAKAIMSYGEITASATFYFDENGALKDMIARRYRMVGKEMELDTWETPALAEREFHGIRIGSTGEALWKLPSGDLPYGRLEIAEIDYNKPELY